MVSENLSNGKGIEKNYITLQEATKLCSYSQEYLSLRARHGKLRSVKFGRNWVTTKEWLEEYLTHNGNGNGNGNGKKEEIFAFVPENLPVGEPAFPKKIKQIDFGNLRPAFAALFTFVLLIGSGVFGKDGLQNVYKEIAPAVQLVFKSQLESIANLTPDVSSLTSGVYVRFRKFESDVLGTIGSQQIFVGNVSVTLGETTKAGFYAFRDYANWIAKGVADSFLTKGLTKSLAAGYKGYVKANQFLEKGLAKDAEQLSGFYGKTSNDVSEKYFALNDSLEKGFVSSSQNIKRSYFAANNFVKEKISAIPQFVSQTFKGAYQFVTSPVKRIISGGRDFASKAEFEKLKSKMEVFEKQPVVIKRVDVEKVVEPVKEITREVEHVQKITQVDAEALKSVRGDIDYLQSEIGKRLYAPGGVVSQTIYVKEPIQSPKIYQENGEIVLQTRGSGNVILSAATGLQMYGSQVVIDSTSVLNPLVYIADQTKIDGPVTAQTITLSPPTNFTGSVLSVGGSGGSKFWIEQDGATHLLGNFTITGNMTVTGNQTYTGAMSISTSSASAALTVAQSGTGPIFNFTSTGSGVTNNLGVISGATTGAVLAVSQTGTGLVIDATGAVRFSEAGLSIPSKVADDLLFATYFNSQSLTGSRGQLAVYSDSDNIPTFQLVDDSSGIAPGGRGLLFSYSGETLYYPASGNIGSATGTISFWYSPDYGYSTTTNKSLFETQNHLRILYNGTAQKFVAQAYDGTDWSTSTATSSAQTFSADNWIYIAVSFAASSSTAPITIYVNNQVVAGANAWTPQSLPTSMYIGSDSSGANQAQGLIADFAVFDRVLTQQEIQQIYHLKRPIEDYGSTTLTTGAKYARVITVAKWGGDFTTITGALNSITDNAAGSPYLIRVMPGTYSEQVTMKNYVDIIAPGGPEVTKIQQTTATTTITASYSLLQGFTVEKTTDNANAIIAVSSTSAINGRLEDLKIVGAGTASQIGVFIGNSATTTLNQLTFSTLNTGIKQTGSATTTLIYSEITATTDISIDAGILNSAFNNLKGTTNFNIAAGATVNSYKDTYKKLINSGTFSQKDYERNDAVTGLTVKQSGSGGIFLATSTSSMASTAFQITNLGSGNSFVVEDSDTDATPFVIDASGNMAVGTTTARYLTDIWGDMAIGTSTATSSTAAVPAFYVDSGISPQIGIGTSTLYGLLTVGTTTPTLIVDGASNVGISTTTPSAKFAVQGQSYFSATSTIASGLNVNAGQLYVQTGSGNVGIGTTTPRYKLDIWGDMAVGTSTGTGAPMNYPLLFVNSGEGGLSNGVGIGTTTVSGTILTVGTSTAKFIIDQAGNVGVNTSTPSYLFSVQGKGFFTATTTIASDLIVSGDTKTGVTKIIAASTTPNGAARADYVATGTDDQAVINRAIDSLPNHGGKILLLEGNFRISSPIIINKAGVTLEGVNRGSRDGVVTFAGTTIMPTGTITGIIIKGPDEPTTAVITAPMVKNLAVQGGCDYGIRVTQNAVDVYLQDLTVLDCGTAAVSLEQAAGSVSGWFYLTNVNLTGGTTAALVIDGVSYVHLVGSGIYSANGDGILIQNSANTVSITNTFFAYDRQHQIHINNGSRISISDVQAMLSDTATDNTYDGVFIEGSSSRDIKITNSSFWGADATHRLRYGINASAGNVNFTAGGNTFRFIGTADTNGTMSGWQTNSSNEFQLLSNVQLSDKILYGSAASNGSLTLRTTTNSTKASSYIILADDGGRVGIATSSPRYTLDVWGDMAVGTSTGTGAPMNYPLLFVNSGEGGLSNGVGIGTTTVSGNLLTVGTTTSALVVSQNGYVGIATSTPTPYSLSVGGDIYMGANKFRTSNLLLREEDSSTLSIWDAANSARKGLNVQDLGFVSSLSAVSNGAKIYAPNTDDYYLAFYARDNGNTTVEVARLQGAADPYFQATNLYSFRESGRVGIATSSPRYTLDVWGDLAVGTSTGTNVPLLYVDSGAGYGSVGIGTTTPSGLLTVGTTTPALVVANNGNVGIGTTTPGSTLEIAASKTINFNSSPVSNLTLGTNADVNSKNINNIATTNFVANGDIRSAVDNSTLGIYGGQNSPYGAALLLSGKDHANAGMLTISTPNTAKSAQVERMRITGDADTANISFTGGNVGIATSSPRYLLDIWGDLAVGTSTGTNVPLLYVDSGSNYGSVGIGTSTPSGLLTVGTTTPALFVANNGNVGIGTASPGASLDVRNTVSIGTAGSTNGQLNLQSAGAGETAPYLNTDNGGYLNLVAPTGWLVFNPVNGILFQRNNTEVMRIDDTTGNVGIATSSPRYKLDIWGDLAVGTSTDTNTPALYVDSGNGGRIGIGTTTLAGLLTVGTTTPTLIVDGASNVGISTTTPSAKFAVQGNIIGSGNIVLYGSATSTFGGGMIVDTNTLYVMADTNNVGIGTTGPQEKLVLGSGSNFATEMAVPTSISGTTIAGTLTATTYYIKVVASDGVGTTVGSSEYSTTTAAAQGIQLSWTAPQGAQSYRAYIGTSSGSQDRYYFASSTTYWLATTTVNQITGTVPTITTAYVNKTTASGNSWFLGGNLGIATSSPRYLMDIWGDMAVGTSTNTNTPAFYVDSGAGGRIGIGTTTLAGLLTVGTTTPFFVVDPVGNVGIGTTTPAAKLSVVQTGQSDILNLWANATSVMSVDVSGNVALTGAMYQDIYGSDDGLVGYWSFSEGMTSSSASTVYDKSPYGNDGTAINMPMPTRNATSGESGWSTTTCKVAGCMSFDGINDAVTIPDSTSMKPAVFTVSAWINWDGGGAHASDAEIFMKGDLNTSGYGLGLNKTNSYAYVQLSGVTSGLQTVSSPNNSITQNKWHFIVGTYNLQNIIFYLDGKQVASQAFTEAINYTTTEGAIGNRSAFYNVQFSGDIDEVKVYNRALSVDEIRTQYLQGNQTSGALLADKFRIIGTDNNIDFQSINGTTTIANGLIIDTNSLYVLADTNTIGIGTTTPRYKLDIWGDLAVGTSTDTNTPALYVDSGNGGRIGIGTTTLAGLLTVGTTTPRFVVAPDGNVGIASSTPSYTLSVGGDIYFGSNNLRTNSLLLKQEDANTLSIWDSANSNRKNFYASELGFSANLTALSNAASFSAPNADDQYLMFKARDNGNTTVEVARLQGAADPYFQATNLYSFRESGRVGIATSSPRYTLDIWGDLAVGTSTGTNVPLLYVDSGAGYGSVGIGTSTPSGLLTVGTTTPALFVANSGNVGIGTAEPARTLEIRGASNPRIRIRQTNSANHWELGTNDGTDFVIQDSANSINLLRFEAGGGLTVTGNSGNATIIRNVAAANDLNLVTAGGGNVGIATTTPRRKLDVWGSMTIGTSTAGKYGDSNGTTTPALYVLSGNGGQVGIGTTTLTGLLTVGTTTPALVVDPLGNVAIGTADSGSYKLKVQGVAGGIINVTDGGARLNFYVNDNNDVSAQIGSHSNDKLGFFTNNNTPSVVLDTNGYFGIATSSPRYALDVWGDFAVGTTTNTNTPLLYVDSGTGGQIGIGTTTPSAMLTINESNDFAFGSFNASTVDTMEGTMNDWHTNNPQFVSTSTEKTIVKVGGQSLKIYASTTPEDVVVRKIYPTAQNFSNSFEKLGFWIYADKIATTSPTTTQLISVGIFSSNNTGTSTKQIYMQSEGKWQYEEWTIGNLQHATSVDELFFRVDVNNISTVNFYVDQIRLYNSAERSAEMFVGKDGNLVVLGRGGVEIGRADGSGNKPGLKVDTAVVEINQPLSVDVGGDVGFDYDLVFNNTGLSQITSEGPLRIAGGDVNHNENLTLTVGGGGDVIVDLAHASSTLMVNQSWAASTTIAFQLNAETNSTTSADSLFQIISDVNSDENVVFDVDAGGNVRYDGTAASPASDVAENYPVLDASIESGDVVCISSEGGAVVEKCSMSYQGNMLGAISSRPALLMASGLENSRMVALAGRIPVKVTLDNGAIAVGDPLTSASSTPGLAMKATQAGKIFGYALEAFNENTTNTDRILAFMHIDELGGDLSVYQNELGNLTVSAYTTTGKSVLFSLDETGALVVGKIKTQELCVGSVCVTEADFMRVFGASLTTLGVSSSTSSVNATVTDVVVPDLPDSVIDSGPATTTTSTAATFFFHSNKADSSFTCQIDSEFWAGCESPKTYASLSVGLHQFKVQAVDISGLTEPTPSIYNWEIVAMTATSTASTATSTP